MTSSPALNQSLYQLVVNTTPHPQQLLADAYTLHSLVKTLVEVLLEQQLSATLWVKLPPGEIWQAEIKRYQELMAVQTIYVCDGEPGGKLPLSAPSQENSTTVYLPGESQLKREYFLIVAAAQFCGFILAHRPRRAKVAGETTAEKHPLLVLVSFERVAVKRLLQELQQALAPNFKENETHSFSQWQAGFSLPPTHNLEDRSRTVLSQLLIKQIQRQDQVWRNGATERKQAAASTAIQRQNEVLLNDLRLKDEFLSHVAQELRTPLTNMKTALTLLESAHFKPAQRQRYMHVLQTECDRQSSLITSLLDLVQLDRIPDRSGSDGTHLADIVPGVVSTYQPLAQEKGIQLAYTVPTALPPVACPETWLKQIAINLLHNSIKFTHQDGQVWVKAKQQGEYLQLEFRDTGIGIVESELPKIFDRFYRSRLAVGEDQLGAGLGLTIVQQLLLRCGGSVSVTSKLGEGSIFKVLLPIKS